MTARQSHTFWIGIIVFGLAMLALPEEGFPGFGPVRIDCCELQGQCFDTTDGPFECPGADIVPGAMCDESINQCVPITAEADPIPTIGEWGLIAMAVIIGIAGFIVMRRRKAAA